ncbi:MAG TPA: glycogen-binding domain-containing protein, partial [Gemmatimonadales bacterium]|nr:glycogen-binding domain-containing protein [Gemmatimonadales bacterium]
TRKHLVLTSLGIALLLLVASVSTAPAQSVLSVDAGFASVSYGADSSIGASVFSIAPTFDLTTNQLSLTASAGYGRFTSGSWSLQGGATGSWYAPPLGPLRPELGGWISGTSYPNDFGTGRYGGLLRLHWLGENSGVWLGGGAGRAWDGFDWQRNDRLEAGGWLRRGPVVAAATVTPSYVGDLRFTDVQLVGRLVRGPAEFTAAAGLRAWSNPDASGSGWAALTAVYWIERRLALTGGIGQYPADFAEGNPQGKYLTLGIRLASGRPPRPTSEREGAELLRQALARPLVPRFEISRGADGVTLTIGAPDAHRVELMGDFTDWQAVALSRDGDRWSVTLPISPGIHRLNLRVDGGKWGVPPGLPVLKDDFGGVVALVSVE